MRKITAEQKEKKEARKKAFVELSSLIEKMTEDERKEMARTHPVVTAEGTSLSINNNCLLIAQNTAVTVVGGYNQWRSHGRHVKKGEKALCIWVPATKKNKEDGAEAVTTTPNIPSFFILGSVFDIAQTEITPPEANEGEVAEVETETLELKAA